ncbi:hypothetical protein LBMAG27_05140 [Bacteroidota bacterium]|nr:hypothetical protein LBMAG27_05140 [Bacteroidota bacterium]
MLSVFGGGTISVNWNTGANWCGGTVPISTTDVVINSTAPNQPEINLGAVATCHNLTINSGASLLMLSNTFNLKGDMVNNGTGVFVQVGGTLVLNGTVVQTIPDITCYNLKIDNSAGVVISGDVTVNNTLNLFNGILSTGGSILHIFNSTPASVYGFSNTSYINGRLDRMIDNGTFDFPLGDATNYELASVTINNISPTLKLLGEYFPDNSSCTPVPNSGGGPYVNGTAISTLLDAGFWTITPDDQPTTGTYDIELNERGYTNNPLGPEYCSVIKRADCFSNWQSLGTHINSTQNISGGTVTAVRTALTSFSDFGIGFSGSILPITLTSFIAGYSDNNTNTILTWETSAEIKCNFYEIEMATDIASDGGLMFSKIGEIKGNGTSGHSHTYSFIDNELNKTGIRYYRLKEVDFDGRINYSDIVSLVFNKGVVSVSSLYPNPTNGLLNYNLISTEEQELKISISNIYGQEIYNEEQMLLKGSNKLEVNIKPLSQGIYYINICPKGETEIHNKFEKFSE